MFRDRPPYSRRRVDDPETAQAGEASGIKGAGVPGMWRSCVLVALGLTSGAMPAVPSPGGEAEPTLARFASLAASHSASITATDPGFRRTDVSVGATRVELSGEPRGQAYGATVGLGGVAPPGYRGQCWARYPGDPGEDRCGLPVGSQWLSPSSPGDEPARSASPTVPVAPPDGTVLLSPPDGDEQLKPAPDPAGPDSARAASVHVEASGAHDQPERTQAKSRAEAATLAVSDLLRIGASTSQSRSFVKDGVVHATTTSRATDVTVGGILHVGTLATEAEVIHPGHTEESLGHARTEVLDATIAGTTVTLGAEGLRVRGQAQGNDPGALTRPVLQALAARGMTIEPLAPPELTRDAVSGLVEASSAGFRVVLSGGAAEELEVILGQARARVEAEDVAPPIPVAPPGVSPSPVSAPVAPAIPAEAALAPAAPAPPPPVPQLPAAVPARKHRDPAPPPASDRRVPGALVAVLLVPVFARALSRLGPSAKRRGATR